MARLTSTKTNSERYRVREEFAERELFTLTRVSDGVTLSFPGDRDGDRDYRLTLTKDDISKLKPFID